MRKFTYISRNDPAKVKEGASPVMHRVRRDNLLACGTKWPVPWFMVTDAVADEAHDKNAAYSLCQKCRLSGD